MAIVKDYVKAIMGLKALGLIDDPFIRKYEKEGKLLSKSEGEGISIDGLMSIMKGEFYDGNNPPPQGRLCYVATYTLDKNGWKDFPDAVKRLIDAGIFPKEFPLEEIMESEKYKQKTAS